MDKARDGVAVAAAADASSSMAGVHLLRAEAKEPAADQRAPGGSVLLDVTTVCGCVLFLLRVAVVVFVGYTFVATAWRVRHDPQNLAFVVVATALLAALLACIGRAERLAAEDSPAGERRRVQAAVWALCAALSCAFAYRVAGVMPPALAVLVWCMTVFVVVVGFFLLVLGEDQRYQALGDDVHDHAAGDREAYAKITPHQLVCSTV